MACGRREPPRLVNLHGFELVESLLNTLPNGHRTRLSQRSHGGHSLLKFLADLGILCFEWRYPKQNVAAALKSKKFSTQMLLRWLRRWLFG